MEHHLLHAYTLRADEEIRIEGGDDGDIDMAENISIASQSDGEFDEMGEPS